MIKIEKNTDGTRKLIYVVPIEEKERMRMADEARKRGDNGEIYKQPDYKGEYSSLGI